MFALIPMSAAILSISAWYQWSPQVSQLNVPVGPGVGAADGAAPDATAGGTRRGRCRGRAGRPAGRQERAQSGGRSDRSGDFQELSPI